MILFLGKRLSQELVDSWNLCWCQHTLSSYKKFYGGQKVADALLDIRQEKNSMLPVTEVQQMENLSTDILSINVWEQIFLPAFSISLIKGEEVKSKWSSEIFGQQSLLFFPHFLLVAWLGAGRTHTKSSFTYFLHFWGREVRSIWKCTSTLQKHED